MSRLISERAMQSTCQRVVRELRKAAPEGCWIQDLADPHAARVLTRAGWAAVSVRPGSRHAHLNVKFLSAGAARSLGVTESGSANILLGVDSASAVADAVKHLAALWPRSEHEVAEAEFIGAVQHVVDEADRRLWARHVFDPGAREREATHRHLPVLRACGSISVDPRTYHHDCPSCQTNYMEKAAQQFWAAAGRFLPR